MLVDMKLGVCGTTMMVVDAQGVRPVKGGPSVSSRGTRDLDARCLAREDV